MFNLIVTYQPWAKGRNSLLPNRLLSYTDDDLVTLFSPDGKHDWGKLRSLPTLFVEECPNDGPQLAYLGTVKTVVPDGGRYYVEAAFDPSVPPIPVRVLKRFAIDLGVTHEFEWSTTHWAVKRGDLFQALFRAAFVQRRQPSIFKLNDHPIIDERLIAVMMPFRAEFDPVYKAIGEACSEAGFRCERADDIWKNESVMQDVVDLIDGSRAVIADCSGMSANVFYEIGIAHTLGRTVIPITQSDDDVPFDVGHLRYALYLNNAEGREELKKKLRARLSGLSE